MLAEPTVLIGIGGILGANARYLEGHRGQRPDHPFKHETRVWLGR